MIRIVCHPPHLIANQKENKFAELSEKNGSIDCASNRNQGLLICDCPSFSGSRIDGIITTLSKTLTEAISGFGRIYWPFSDHQAVIPTSKTEVSAADEVALGDTHKPGAILLSLKPFSLERFLLLRQIGVNCFNSKEINSVHLIA